MFYLYHFQIDSFSKAKLTRLNYITTAVRN